MTERNSNPLFETWRRLDAVSRRFVIGSVLALSAALGILTWYQSHRTMRVPLLPQARLVDADLARMQLAFGQAGLNDFEMREGQIFVDQRAQDTYLKALADSDALPDISRSLYEPESAIDFWSNREQQHEKSLVRKKKMIRQMILQLEFVADAHVDLDELTEPGFPPNITRKVAVVVRPRDDRILERHQIRAIRDTIRGQVAGLERQDVVITDIAAGHAYDAVALDDPAASTQDSLVWLERARIAQRVSQWLMRYTDCPEVRLVLAPAPAAITSAAETSTTDTAQTPRVPAADALPAVIVNQPMELAQSQPVASHGTAVDGRLPNPSPTSEFLIHATVRLPYAAVRQSLGPEASLEELTKFERALVAELQPLLASESLPCRIGNLEVSVARPYAASESQPITSQTTDWQRRSSLWGLLAAVGLIGVAVVWLIRSRTPESAVHPRRPTYTDARWNESPGGHIPLNDETQRRLRDVVHADPDRAAEIIKNWIREAA